MLVSNVTTETQPVEMAATIVYYLFVVTVFKIQLKLALKNL